MIKLAQVSAEQKAATLCKTTLNIKQGLNKLPESKYSNPRVRLLQGYASQGSFGQNKVMMSWLWWDYIFNITQQILSNPTTNVSACS